MTIEGKDRDVPPVVSALPLTVGNVLRAVLDSPFPRLDVAVGTVAADGKRVITKRGTIKPDNVGANPGERVVISKIR